MICKTCGLDHRGWISCGKARADAVLEIGHMPLDAAVELVANVVANTEPVVNMVANKHGRYADIPRRKAYMRDYMRKRRAADQPAE